MSSGSAGKKPKNENHQAIGSIELAKYYDRHIVMSTTEIRSSKNLMIHPLAPLPTLDRSVPDAQPQRNGQFAMTSDPTTTPQVVAIETERHTGKLKWRWGQILVSLAISCIVVAMTAVGVQKMRTVKASDSPAADDARWTQVVVQSLAVRDGYTSQVAYVGRIEPSRVSKLSLERGGLLVEVLVDEGDQVEAGQAIAKLDVDRLVADRQVAASRVQVIEAELQELQAGPRAEEISQARERVRAAQARTELSKAQIERYEKLLRQNATSKEEYDRAFFGKQVNDADLSAALADLLELENGTRSERLMAKQALLRQNRAELNRIELEIDKSILRATFAGRIGERFADEGVVVASAQPIVELLETDRVRVRVALDARSINDLNVGSTYAMSFSERRNDQTRQTFTASLIRKRPDVGLASRTVDAIFLVNDLPPLIRFGELVHLKLPRNQRQSGVWVPTTALTESTRGLWSLMLVEPADDGAFENGRGHTRRLDVELIHVEGDRAFVAGAANDDQLFVSRGLHRLVVGQRVAWQPPANTISIAANPSLQSDAEAER